MAGAAARKLQAKRQASELVRRARRDLQRAEAVDAALEASTRFVDGRSGAGRPLTSGGSTVLYADADAASSLATWTRPRASGPRPRAPGRLTTRLVPRGGHYDEEYCGACEFEGRDHCEFCHTSKLSVRRRMPLVRFARELLLLRPTLTAAQLAAELSRYATSDAAAGVAEPSTPVEELSRDRRPRYHRALCDRHSWLKQDADEVERNHREEVRGLREEVERLKARLSSEATEARRLRAALCEDEIPYPASAEGRCRLLERRLEMARVVVADRDARLAALAREHEALLADEGEELACAETQTRGVRSAPAKTQTDLLVLSRLEEAVPPPCAAPAPAFLGA